MSEASLDSLAVFAQRAKEIGFSDDDIERVRVEGVASLAKFGFACKYSPGQGDESPLVDLGKTIFNSDPVPTAKMSALRRLYFEAYTLSAAELRRKLDNSADTKPVRLAMPERKQRSDEQVARLKGLKIVGDLEPSHALIDRAVKIYEDNLLTRISWAEALPYSIEVVSLASHVFTFLHSP
jgi:hypothetical protein